MSELIALAREDVDAFNAGDWNRLGATYAPGCVYEEPATGRRVEGPDAIVELNQGWKAAFPDAHGTITGEFACDDRVVQEVTWTGTQSGPLQLPSGGAIEPTARRVEVRAVQVMRVADGKLAEIRHYFDMLGMLEQLGTISADELAPAS